MNTAHIQSEQKKDPTSKKFKPNMSNKRKQNYVPVALPADPSELDVNTLSLCLP